jgi:hypothetical protein
MMSEYLLPSVSNGNRQEQALIRRWWHEVHDAKGLIVWEYYLEGKYADAIWFPDAEVTGVEAPGVKTANHYPLNGEEIIMCEAKQALTPEVVGQALVYSRFAERAGAHVSQTVVFAETTSNSMMEVAQELGLSVVISEVR